ncbi:MAG: glycoside hydrolase family 75 protein, partial [Elusimicrobiota bacterium]
RQEVVPPPALVGTPQTPNGEKSGDLYANKHGGPRIVPIYEVKVGAKNTVAVTFTGKMSIDADGIGGASAKDKTGQPETSLKIKGASLNPLSTPYSVMPTGFGHGVELGDYAAVTYRKKTVFTIVGDKGPRDEVGECSISCAAGLEIDHDANTGGVGGGVTYTFLPGSRDSAPTLDAGEIHARGAAKFKNAGIPIE